MTRKKVKGTELNVFKGREAKLNHLVFETLNKDSPQVPWDVFRFIKKKPGYKRVHYTNVNRRMRALTEQCYLDIVGTRRLQRGDLGILYQLTTKAHVAFFLKNLGIETFLNEASEDVLMTALAAILLYIEEAEEKTVKENNTIYSNARD